MSDAFALAELERLLSNLVRVGVIDALDTATARVRVRVGEITTDWLPWLAPRAGATRVWSAPTVGEQALLVSPYGDMGQAVALVGLFSDGRPANGNSADVDRVTFADGAVAEYNSATHVLTVTTSGNVVINCAQATINASGSVQIDTPQTTVTGSMTVGGSLAVNGSALTHQGTNVGSTHRHPGVRAGSDQSGTPV